MPTAQRANDGNVGIAIQATEGTMAAEPQYVHDLYSGLYRPVRQEAPVEVSSTDNISTGLWASEQHWEGTPAFPAHPKVLGAYLKGLLGGVSTGAGPPYTHTITYSDTPGFVTAFQKRPGGLYETFVDGTVGRMALAFEAGQALRVEAGLSGKTMLTGEAAHVASVATELFTADTANPVFSFIGSTLKLDDDATPATTTVTNIASGTITMDRTVAQEQTNAFTPSFRDLGRFEVGLSLNTKWTSYETYRATFFGAVAGTADSATQVYGSIIFRFEVGPTTDASNKSLIVTIPRIKLAVPEPPDVDPAGGPLMMALSGVAVKPTSGAFITVALQNSEAAYPGV